MVHPLLAALRTLDAVVGLLARRPGSALPPAASVLVTVLLTFVTVLPSFAWALRPPMTRDPAALLRLAAVVYAAYLQLHFVMDVAAVSLLSTMAARLDGRADPGLARTLGRVAPVALHTFVSATLGLAGFLGRYLVNPVFGAVIAPALGRRLWRRWQRVSYGTGLVMALPAIALDDAVPTNPFARGAGLVAATWGDDVRPAHGIGILFPLAVLPITVLATLPILRRGLALGDPDVVRAGLLGTLFVTAAWMHANTFVNAVFALAAYRHATAGRGDVFPGDPSWSTGAFVPSGARAGAPS